MGTTGVVPFQGEAEFYKGYSHRALFRHVDGFIMESTIWGRDVEGAPCQWAMDQFLCRVPPRYKGCESAGDANKLNRPRNGFIESHSELLTGNKESAANIPWDRMTMV